MSRTSWLVPCVLLLLIAVVALSVRAENKPSEPVPEINFSGRIVWIFVDQSSALEQRRSTEILREPTIQKIGNRYFIIGEAVLRQKDGDNTYDWRKGAVVGLAWDVVQQYYSYTPEQFEEVMERWTDEDQE
jgi:hypothetical protein